MKKNVHLFVIDPQNDFCNPNGNLYVAGADKDMSRLAAMIKKNSRFIEDIYVTLDSHHLVHIAHPIFWVDSNGNHPAPFTMISVEDVEKGTWRTFNPAYQKRGLEYVKTLKANNKYVLVIWPPHCLIGSNGHSVVPELFDALTEWEKQFAMVNYITKGSNLFTEHYSAVKADVIDTTDTTTMLNDKLIDLLKKVDKDSEILIAGEARSHCVANTLRDVVAEFSPEEAKKFVILEDCMSDVTGFEKNGQDFISEMKAKGVKVSTSDKYFN